MRIEDGIFGRFKLLTGPTNISDPLPLHDETFIATSADISPDAYLKDDGPLGDEGDPNPDFRADSLTTLNTDWDPAKVGEECYVYPAMAGKCVKIYTNNTNSANVKIRPLEGKNDGTDDVIIELFAGMMLPIPCKGIELPNGKSILILA